MRALDYDYESDDDEPTRRLVRGAETLSTWTGSTSIGPMLLPVDPSPVPSRAPPIAGLRLRYLVVLLLVANAILIGVLHRYGVVGLRSQSPTSRAPRDCTTSPRPLITTSATQKSPSRTPVRN